METYYAYRDVKVMIAHRLMKLQGWTVYDYHADDSDLMTDYYSPAYWNGVAEKNGYVLCVNLSQASEPKEVREYNRETLVLEKGVLEKIEKLKQMTVERGASRQEEESARQSIERLMQKAELSKENKDRYIVTGTVPGHMANPPRTNWHIEKDGMIIAKGTGILKYAGLYAYDRFSRCRSDLEAFRNDPDAYEENEIESLLRNGSYTTRQAAEASVKSHRKELEEDIKMLAEFDSFINQLDTTCGGLLGEGYVYEKVMTTKYRTEQKIRETSSGSVKDGQMFVLKTNFNYGHRKGMVYRIHETRYKDTVCYHAYKLNRKLTKECHGNADSSNSWSCFDERFYQWLEKGSIAWCELEEVQTPYEVEKVVKRRIKPDSADGQEKKEEGKEPGVSPAYEIEESEHTKTHERIWLVRFRERMERETFQSVRESVSRMGGYYSRYTHSFVFRFDPRQALQEWEDKE